MNLPQNESKSGEGTSVRCVQLPLCIPRAVLASLVDESANYAVAPRPLAEFATFLNR